MEEQKDRLGDDHADCTRESKDPMVSFLHKVIRQAVRVLAVLMTLVILWGILDVIWVLCQNIMAPPRFLLSLGDILATFSAFLAVLIAIEIFINITMYLRDDVIHVKLVVATALMAVARKVVAFDFNEVSAEYVWASGVLVLALGIIYYLLGKNHTTGASRHSSDPNHRL